MSNMKRAITLKDIARETGVHVSTVSRALDPNGRSALTEDVVMRIRETAQRMGYRPNRLASGLRTSRTMTVGIVIPDITNTIFPPILRGVESVLEPLGYASIIVNTDNAVEREARLLDVLRERGVDGIVHAAVPREDPRIDDVVSQGTPVVTVNRRLDRPGIPAIVSDEEHGISLLMDHLHAAGHRRIAHIAGPEAFSTGQARLRAFGQTAARLGIEAPPGNTIHAQRFHEREGMRCTEELLDRGWPFTALVCANDRLALGAIQALQGRGLTCPGDVSVTGFNDMPFLDLIPPGLTTVRIAQYDVGQAAAQVLLRLMTGRAEEVAPETVLPVQLVCRGTVAPPRG
jgi:LacI family transcriptional regulator